MKKKKNCDTEGCNGVVYVISKVLSPPAKNLFEIIDSDTRLMAFSAAVLKAGLASMLNGTRPLTIFAPTNAAFSKISPDRLSKLLKDPRKLKDLIKYHIVSGSIFRCAVGKTCPVSTTNGRSVLLNNSNKGGLVVNSALSVQKELVGTNGLIYPVESVLMPREGGVDTFRRFWKVFLP